MSGEKMGEEGLAMLVECGGRRWNWWEGELVIKMRGT